MENEPAAATLSLKVVICDATASPDVAAMSASICVSSSVGGPAKSVLQPTAPTVISRAATVSIGFLSFIKRWAPLIECAAQRGSTYHTKEHGKRNAKLADSGQTRFVVNNGERF